MIFTKNTIAWLALSAVLAVPTALQAGDKDIIEYRQHIMKAMDAQTAALGQILTLMVKDDHFASHLDVIALNAQMALKSFEQEVHGGEARPEVWQDWDDFSERMNAFSEGVATAALLAREKGKDAAMEAVIDALSCKQCHDVYRDKEKH